jgi:hypothetical protein
VPVIVANIAVFTSDSDFFTFHVEHIIPRQHGGSAVLMPT